MALQIIDKGAGNVVEVAAGIRETGAGTIILDGSNIVLRIGAGCTTDAVSIALGPDCTFEVGENCRLAALEVVARSGATIAIGAATNFTWHTRLLLHEPAAIRIGAGCLVASDTLFTASDMHSILDRATGRRINPPADILVGDRVWIAHAASVLKGSVIGEGSVIALGSVVAGRIAPFSLAAGTPARTIREDITWDAALLPV